MSLCSCACFPSSSDRVCEMTGKRLEKERGHRSNRIELSGDMLDVYSKGYIAIPHHLCTVKHVNDLELSATRRVLGIFVVIVSIYSIGEAYSGSRMSLSLLTSPPSHLSLTYFRFVLACMPFNSHRGGGQCTATERSYVDLPIVGSGGSSVGGELVGWLRGVWPHNHSHNDSLLSVSLPLSFVYSSRSHPPPSVQLFLSFHRRAFHSFVAEASRLALANRNHGRADNNSEAPSPSLSLSLSLVRTVLTLCVPLSARSWCARGGRDTPVRVRRRELPSRRIVGLLQWPALLNVSLSSTFSLPMRRCARTIVSRRMGGSRQPRPPSSDNAPFPR